MDRWTPKKETAVLKEKDANAVAGPGGKFCPRVAVSNCAAAPQSVAAQLLLVSGAASLD